MYRQWEQSESEVGVWLGGVTRGVARWILKASNATASFFWQGTSAGFRNSEEGEWAASKVFRPPTFTP